MVTCADRGAIVVIAVNYESDALALRFVRAVTEAGGGTSTRIVLVDNTQRVDSSALFDLVRAENPTALCIKPPTNLGYFRGAWYGLQQYRSLGHAPDWVMVANVDISFPDKEIFAKLRNMTPGKETGIMAPSIQSTFTLHDQNPMMRDRPSRTRMRFHRFVHRSYYLLNLYEILSVVLRLARSTIESHFGSRPVDPEGAFSQRPEQIDPLDERTVPIYAPHGSCMIFTNAFFARGGSLEVPFFLYGEEVYVAETARALGLTVLYNPCLRVQHDEHQSTRARGVLLSRQVAKYLRETTDYLVDAYFS